ncbi:RcnB family protein [Sphingomonas sp. KRR8]|uniref:RcnB family protein n=1 Tax=Sphingomonas sp. KRR8 TaxID=2942996 RepID=UPI00202040E5|nr:RcnB family protein [Sphingomonas sp. KRR8]URD59637.1 RcnB family protein [Sphingomonas sp. KRR8]
MRKLILLGLMAATAVPTVANAQARQEIRHDRREVREDRRELRQDRRELRRDQREMRRDRRSAYVAPYAGWRYRPVVVGYQLRPAFWGNRYVVNDYGRWNLARPGVNQRWVRYGDDLLLVNARNGRVLRVIHNRY